MSLETALDNPKQTTASTTRPNHDNEMVTYRIEIEGTGRLLTQGFHIAPAFMPRECELDRGNGYEPVAEFGTDPIAQCVIEKLDHAAPLIVRRQEWGALAGMPLERLCNRVDRTGAHINMLLWTPPSRAARALMDMPTGRVRP